jgi:peptidoglycan/LPS O-acetylase OafA/YrhL
LAVKESSNLDLLRSFAVACVLVRHLLLFLDPDAPGVTCLGTVGVLCFFVHTSYVLLLSIHRSRIGWFGFQIRRVFRIYPLAIIAVIFYFAFKIPSYCSGGVIFFPPTTPRALFANFLLIQNLTGDVSVAGVLWSLPFELQMYLVLPLVFWICSRFKVKGAWTLYLSSLVVFVAFGLMTLSPSAHNLLYQFRYFPCFLCGALLFSSHIKPMFHWTGMFVVLGVAYAISSGAMLTNLLWQWAICLFVALCIPLCSEIPQGIVSSSAKIIARYSYGIYLSHFAAFDGAFALFGNKILASVAGILFTAVLSYAAFRWIEEPLINIGKRLADFRFRPITPNKPEPSYVSTPHLPAST